MTGAEIADRLEALNQQAVEYVLGPASQRWHEVNTAEGWPVGVTARHIALGHVLMLGWAAALKAGTEITGIDEVDAVNARHAELGVVASPDDVARALVSGANALSEALRQLSEEDLAGPVMFGGREMPAAMLADASFRHVEVHLASLRQACGD